MQFHFSSLEHIISTFQTLCGGKLADDLTKVTNRWIYETTGVENVLIEDYKQICADIALLFSLRHQVCHEGTSAKENSIDFAECLNSLSIFIDALYWHLTDVLYGKIPLTQTAMNIDSIEKFRIAEMRMKEVLEQVRVRCDGDGRKLKLLNLAQASWERYCHLQATFRHDPQGGGSIGPMLRALEAEELTIERTKHLLWYAERKEGEM